MIYGLFFVPLGPQRPRLPGKVLPSRAQFRFDPIRLFRSLWSRNAPFASR